MDRRQGRWEEHIGNLERAVHVDPRNLDILHHLAESYKFLRRFSDMAAVLDRTLVITPADALSRVFRASVDLDWRAHTRALCATIHDVVAEDPNVGGAIADQWLDLALCEHDPAEAERALAAIPREGIATYLIKLLRPFYKGLAARARDDGAAAHSAFTAARVEMEKIVDEQPDYPEGLCVLGMIDAGLGRKEDALREGRRAVELLPVTKDALCGAQLIKNLAIIYTWTGEKQLALNQLAIALQTPCPISYGELRLHPYWDSLRGEPRFEKLVEEAEKPVAL
jgi:tetratricopeptide (TPR) repeat protein